MTVTTRVECARCCWHVEDETYKFDPLRTEATPMESEKPGTCTRYEAPVTMHLRQS